MSFQEIPGGVCAPKGFSANSVYSGLRRTNKDDFMLLVSDRIASVAGCLTKNEVQAWCVLHNHQRLELGKAKGVICFAGNANACNGSSGKQVDLDLSQLTAVALNCQASQILTASTGVIGREVPFEKLRQSLPSLISGLGNYGEKVASAIMTTDLVSKLLAVRVESNGKVFTIGGMAKGSGMIAPNMATMLGFISTDLECSPQRLRELLSSTVDKTFNRITVDGDTSTNDMVFLLANGASGVMEEQVSEDFANALNFVCERLAKMIARDGEGATKLVEIRVSGFSEGATQIARTIAESPLVKTACFGNDPNWGRVLAAAGRAGVALDPLKIAIYIGGIEVFRAGEPTVHSPNDVSLAMRVDPLVISIESLNPKIKAETVSYWTCDFSYDYVKINADYCT